MLGECESGVPQLIIGVGESLETVFFFMFFSGVPILLSDSGKGQLTARWQLATD